MHVSAACDPSDVPCPDTFRRHKGASGVSIMPPPTFLFQALIFYFTVGGQKKNGREKKAHFLRQNVSCFCLRQTAPCLAVQFTCPTATRAVVPLCFRQGTEHTVHGEDRLT